MKESAASVIAFWFEEITPKQWFEKDLSFDEMMRDRFLSLHLAAKAGELFDWRVSAIGRLAEVIVLDQFARNLYRDHADAFSCDAMALVLAQHAVQLGEDGLLTTEQKPFLYMPYMHSESQRIHEEAVLLFDQPGLENNLHFEHRHKEIIDRFGRYPHRNAILGRASTTDELLFLESPGSSF